MMQQDEEECIVLPQSGDVFFLNYTYVNSNYLSIKILPRLASVNHRINLQGLGLG